MEFSSRMKDYYDLYYIANKFDLDSTVLIEALRKTFANREHSFTVEQFKKVLGYDSHPDMQKKWRAFVRKVNIQTEDFETVLETIKDFLEQPFAAAVEDNETGEEN